MPIAYYASWQLSDRNRGFIDFYELLARDGFTAGPPWFIWVLLLFDVALALVLVSFRKQMPVLGRCMENLKHHTAVAFVVVFVLAALVYLPLLSRYGFGTWTILFTSPFAFQICRIGLYGLWFVFAVLAGMPEFENGFLSKDGGLVRYWRLWALVCIAAYNALWFVPRLSMVHDPLSGALCVCVVDAETVAWLGHPGCVQTSVCLRGLDSAQLAYGTMPSAYSETEVNSLKTPYNPVTLRSQGCSSVSARSPSHSLIREGSLGFVFSPPKLAAVRSAFHGLSGSVMRATFV